MSLEYPLDNQSKGSIEEAKFLKLQARQFKGGLPIFTANRTDSRIQGETYVKHISGSPQICTFVNGVETCFTSGSGGSVANIGGTNTQIQFNDAGAFGGSSFLTFDKSAGGALNLKASNGAALTGTGGLINIVSGVGGTVGGESGAINITVANSTTGTITGGDINIEAGTGRGRGYWGGNVTVYAGAARGSISEGGYIGIYGGDNFGGGNGGGVEIVAGQGIGSGDGGEALVRAGRGGTVSGWHGGPLLLEGGDASGLSPNGNGGDVYITPGTRAGTGKDGDTILGINNTSTTRVGNFVYIPSTAGAITGTPTAQTGKVAMTYDTSNNRLYVYNSGWKSVTLS